LENHANRNIDLFAALWKGKWIIVGTTLLFAVLSLIIALSLTNIYRSDALLAPVSSESKIGGGLASLSSQFGGLASMAGISLGGVQTDKTTLAIEYLRSRTFLIDFIARHSLKVPIMAAVGWDRESDQLRIGSDIYDQQANRWVRKVESPKKPEPSSWEVYEAFLEMIAVERNSQTGLVSLSVEHYSPTLAKQWVELLVSDLNAFMANKDKLESENSIQFLQNQISETAIVGMQSVIYGLIEEQLKTKMLAEVREDYVFSYVDPPLTPEQKFKPKRAVICIVGTFTGGLLGCLSVLLLAISKGARKTVV